MQKKMIYFSVENEILNKESLKVTKIKDLDKWLMSRYTKKFGEVPFEVFTKAYLSPYQGLLMDKRKI